MKALFLSVAMLVLVGGCAGTPPLQSVPSDVKTFTNTEMPPPDRQDLLGQNRPYLIGPFDRLIIDVFGVETLSKQEVQVDSGGQLSFPLAGTVAAAGRTPNELEKVIAGNLTRYVRDPQVTVNLKETVSQVITIEGAVREPGLYPVVGRMSLLRAVATAKGTTEIAQLSNVVVYRTVSGQKLAALYNLKAIRRGNYADPELYANDVVVVDESQARRLFRDFAGVASLLTTPIVVAIQKL